MQRCASSAIDVYLLTGYLGAGKTTVLNHLLAAPEAGSVPTALLINEFGTLGLDGALIEPGPHAVIELSRGSLFCVCARSGLLDALARIRDELAVDRLLVEASGIAEPADFQVALDEVRLHPRATRSLDTRPFRMKSNVCVVDAHHVAEVLPFLPVVTQQIRHADGLVLNKVDELAGETSAIERVLRDINHSAPILRSPDGAVPWSFFIDLPPHHFKPQSALTGPPPDVVSVAIDCTSIDLARMQSAIRQLGDRLLRLKAVVEIDSAAMLVESVCGIMQCRPAPEVQRRGVSAVGYRIPRDELQRRLAVAVEPAP